jgi:hypothetical protein
MEAIETARGTLGATSETLAGAATDLKTAAPHLSTKSEMERAMECVKSEIMETSAPTTSPALVVATKSEA